MHGEKHDAKTLKPSTNPARKEKEGAVWQVDNNKAWRNMIAYWILGALVGNQINCFPTKVFSTDRNFPIFAIVSAGLVTASCQAILLPRFGSFGRRRSWLAVVVFALFNGSCETCLFLASYDAGKGVAARVGSNAWFVKLVGYSAYSVYSALVHAKFWLPFVFPRHILPTAPLFATTALPALMAMSLAWLWLYEHSSHEAVGVIMLQHAFVDAVFAARICLPPPAGLSWRCEPSQLLT